MTLIDSAKIVIVNILNQNYVFLVMNIIELIKQQPECEGRFTLPSGESVEGRLMLESQYDHSIIL